ncbi:MAG TPA: DUF4282 domain-containing protein [Acidimicrobiales bacterium]|nr:DUF4282 domain-containing protein [Acidimicrobiales bacterium]
MSDVPPQEPPTGGYPSPGPQGPPPAQGQPPAATPPPGWGPPPPPDYGVPGYATSNAGDAGFFGSLFDMSFSSFVTTKLVKIIYVLAMVVIGLMALAQVIVAVASGESGAIVASLLFVPLFALLALIWTRVGLELVIVVFRIGEDARRTADSLARRSG